MAKFDYNSIVYVKDKAPLEMRPGSKAWIIGVFRDRYKDKFEWLAPGNVYTIEFEDGQSLDIVEDMLILAELSESKKSKSVRN